MSLTLAPRRRASRATSIAVLPPPITATWSPTRGGLPVLMASRRRATPRPPEVVAGVADLHHPADADAEEDSIGLGPFDRTQAPGPSIGAPSRISTPRSAIMRASSRVALLAVRGDGVAHEPPGLPARLVDRHPVAEDSPLPGAGQPGRPGAEDGDPATVDGAAWRGRARRARAGPVRGIPLQGRDLHRPGPSGPAPAGALHSTSTGHTRAHVPPRRFSAKISSPPRRRGSPRAIAATKAGTSTCAGRRRCTGPRPWGPRTPGSRRLHRCRCGQRWRSSPNIPQISRCSIPRSFRLLVPTVPGGCLGRHPQGRRAWVRESTNPHH